MAVGVGDEEKHPPGMNVWGRPLKTENSIGNSWNRYPGKKTEKKMAAHTGSIPPEIVEQIKRRYASAGEFERRTNDRSMTNA